jgi:hypothetical protein
MNILAMNSFDINAVKPSSVSSFITLIIRQKNNIINIIKVIFFQNLMKKIMKKRIPDKEGRTGNLGSP